MSLIQCHFDYASSFWYPSLSKVLKTNFRLPKIKSRGLFLTWIQGHLWALTFSSLLAGYLFQKELTRLFRTMFFKVKSGQSPDYMVEHFILASSIHSYGTRFRETGCFSIPKVKGFWKAILI